jgi:hypothetical protein
MYNGLVKEKINEQEEQFINELTLRVAPEIMRYHFNNYDKFSKASIEYFNNSELYIAKDVARHVEAILAELRKLKQ